VSGLLDELADRADAALGQALLGDRAHAPHQAHRERVQELPFTPGLDDDQTVRLRDLRGDLRQVLGAGGADRDRQPDLAAHAPPDARADHRRGAEEVRGT